MHHMSLPHYPEDIAETAQRFPDKLWSDLRSDEERIEFLRSGRAHETGIIAPCMVDDIINLLQLREELTDLVLAAMDDPPRQPKDAGNWEERARRAVG
jgi:hypothetical protein